MPSQPDEVEVKVTAVEYFCDCGVRLVVPSLDVTRPVVERFEHDDTDHHRPVFVDAPSLS